VTFEQLRVFQAIVATGTFRGAAVSCHKSQPAVSALIRNLEDTLGVQLFDRSSYRPKLTEQGRHLHDQALVILKEITKMETMARRMDGGEEPEVRLSVNRAFPIGFLLKVLKETGQQYPNTRITLTSQALSGVIEKLAMGEVELAITYEQGMDPSCMEAYPLTTVKIIPVAHPSYGPAARGGHNTVEDVREDVQVIVTDSATTTSKHSMDIIPNARQWRVTEVADKKAIILAGMGWGGLPEHVVAEELERGELVRVDVAGFLDRDVHLSIIRRTDRPAGAVAQSLWQALKGLRGRIQPHDITDTG